MIDQNKNNNQNIIFVHTSDGMHIRNYIDSNNWEILNPNMDSMVWNNIIEDLSCHHITAKSLDVGIAHIVSVPFGAKIFIGDINYIGTTPATITDIPVGPHPYKLSYTGYSDVDGILFIESGKTYELSVVMEKVVTGLDSSLLLYLFGAGTFMLLFYGSRKEKKVKYEKEEFEEV
jgi:hypothetical protein